MKVLLEPDEALGLALQSSREVALHPPVNCLEALVAESVIDGARRSRALPHAKAAARPGAARARRLSNPPGGKPLLYYKPHRTEGMTWARSGGGGVYTITYDKK